MRMAAGIIVGILLAFASVWAIEALVHSLFPAPAGLDPYDRADQARIMAVMTVGAKAAVLGAYFLATLVGGLVANRIGRSALPGWIVAFVVVAAGIATMIMIPHPVWMWVGGIVLPLAAAWLAQRLGGVPA